MERVKLILKFYNDMFSNTPPYHQEFLPSLKIQGRLYISLNFQGEFKERKTMQRRKDLQQFAKRMRKTTYTEAEKKLWQYLRNRQLGYKFTRQYVFDNRYIVDFICAEKKMIIEVDGGQHHESKSDVDRDNYLKTRGYVVLRLWNNDVLQNIEGCLITIKKCLDRNPI